MSDEIAKRLGGWPVDQTAMRYDHDGRLKEMREAVEKGGGGRRGEEGEWEVQKVVRQFAVAVAIAASLFMVRAFDRTCWLAFVLLFWLTCGCFSPPIPNAYGIPRYEPPLGRMIPALGLAFH